MKACPFCASTNVREISLDGCTGPCRAVACMDCEAHGPISDSAEDAVAAWEWRGRTPEEVKRQAEELRKWAEEHANDPEM